VKFVKPECRASSTNIEISATTFRPRDQNAQERLTRQVLLAAPSGKRPSGRPRTRWCNYIFNLSWFCLGVEPAELSVISGDREAFRVLLGQLPPRPSSEESGYED